MVDFPAVLQVLEEHHFRGPITMEVEGIHGVVLDEAQTKQYIAEFGEVHPVARQVPLSRWQRKCGAAALGCMKPGTAEGGCATELLHDQKHDQETVIMPLFAETDASISKAIQGPDYVMLIGYFVLMLGIGLYFYRFMRGMKVYFTGGNKIPWWLAGVSFYMSSFSAYAFVIYSGLCFKLGWVGVTLFWVMIPATIISVTFFATRWRRARIDSPVEFLESRYSALVRQLFVWLGLPVGIIDDSLKLIATGTIVHVGMGFSLETSIIACGLIMLAYTFMGGLWAVTVTDFVQFVILAVAVLALFPLSIAKAGGFQSLVDHTPPGFFALSNGDLQLVLHRAVGRALRRGLQQHALALDPEVFLRAHGEGRQEGGLAGDGSVHRRAAAVLHAGHRRPGVHARHSLPARSRQGDLSAAVRLPLARRDAGPDHRRHVFGHDGQPEQPLQRAGQRADERRVPPLVPAPCRREGTGHGRPRHDDRRGRADDPHGHHAGRRIGPRAVQVHGEPVRRRGGPLGASLDRRAGFPPRHAAERCRGRDRRRVARDCSLLLPVSRRSRSSESSSNRRS